MKFPSHLKTRWIPQFALTVIAIFLNACSKDEGPATNNSPVIVQKQLLIDEHVAPGTLIGTIGATDPDNDVLTFGVDTDRDIIVNESTGELTVGPDLLLDYEVEQSFELVVQVFDGVNISRATITVSINNIDEWEFLSDGQKELVDELEYLAFWEHPDHTPLEYLYKWTDSIKVSISGNRNASFDALMQENIDYFNQILEGSTLGMSMVANGETANLEVFFGTEQDLSSKWPDMYDIISGGSYSGYAMTDATEFQYRNSRIWISVEVSALIQHEIGHTLGLGHSLRCDEKSIMCTTISAESAFLPIEIAVLNRLYQNNLAPSTPLAEVRAQLANILYLEGTSASSGKLPTAPKTGLSQKGISLSCGNHF